MRVPETSGGHKLASVVGLATTAPINPTRPLAAERQTRSALWRKARRNWRR